MSEPTTSRTVDTTVDATPSSDPTPNGLVQAVARVDDTSGLSGWSRPFGKRPSPALVYLASLQAEGSRATMKFALNRILRILLAPPSVKVETFEWHMLRAEHTSAIRAKLSEKFSPASANQSLAALRGTLKSAWRMGLIESDPYQKAIDFSPVKGARIPPGRHLSNAEIQRLFEYSKRERDPWLGARNSALIAVMFGAGLRRSEATDLNVEDINLETGAMVVRGKGNKHRSTFLPPGAIQAVSAWLERRTERTPDGAIPTKALLLSGRYGLQHARMTAGGVLFALNRVAKKAGVRSFTPHDLRRTFIGDLLDAGADLASIQAMVGHASPTTTSKYDRRGDRAKAQSAGLLNVPYR